MIFPSRRQLHESRHQVYRRGRAQPVPERTKAPNRTTAAAPRRGINICGSSTGAHAAVKNKGSYFQAAFWRLLPRLGYQSAIWAIAHRLCGVGWKILHEGVRFIERGCEPDPRTKKKRTQMLARALRKLGYEVAITPINPVTATHGMCSAS